MGTTFESAVDRVVDDFSEECELGCNDEAAYNFDPQYNVNDGSCVTAATVTILPAVLPAIAGAIASVDVIVRDARCVSVRAAGLRE